ncbi:MAG: 6-hydroxymethylpterin diphosphokinase MptE-like protein [Flavobacteriaceae bacterium]
MKTFDLIVRKSKPARDVFDRMIFKAISKFNKWSLFDDFKAKPVLVVGNGPSLNKTNFDNFEDHVSIGMNKINMFYKMTNWRPDIIVCVNGAVLWQNRRYFNNTKALLIVPPRAMYLGIKKRKNVFVLNFHKNDDFSSEIETSIANGVTVSYPCLQIANYLEPTKVSIVGIDHSYKFEGKSQVYKKHESNGQNHFSADYFKNQVWGTPNLEHSEVQYAIAKKTFEKNNIEALDYTINGKLQVFKKGKISTN